MVYRTRLAARRGVLTCLSRGTGVQVGAIFDVRALLTPPLAAERMVRLSSNGFSCRNACLNDRRKINDDFTAICGPLYVDLIWGRSWSRYLGGQPSELFR